jgi:hypothetical protein
VTRPKRILRRLRRRRRGLDRHGRGEDEEVGAAHDRGEGLGHGVELRLDDLKAGVVARRAVNAAVRAANAVPAGAAARVVEGKAQELADHVAGGARRARLAVVAALEAEQRLDGRARRGLVRGRHGRDGRGGERGERERAQEEGARHLARRNLRGGVGWGGEVWSTERGAFVSTRTSQLEVDPTSRLHDSASLRNTARSKLRKFSFCSFVPRARAHSAHTT